MPTVPVSNHALKDDTNHNMTMSYCPHCGYDLRTPSVASAGSASPTKTKEALDSLLAKVKELAPRFDTMTEREWGEWVDSLEFSEFLELIALGSEGIGKAICAGRGEC